MRFGVVFRLWVMCMLAMTACDTKQSARRMKGTLYLTIENAYNQSIYVERKGLFGEPDSVVLKVAPVDRVVELQLDLADSSERLYQVRSTDARVNVYFINDASDIRAKIDYLEPTNIAIEGSPATTSLLSFYKLIEQSVQAVPKKRSPFDGAGKSRELNRLAYNYVDTTTSAAAALMVFNTIDFGKDYDGIESFLTRLSARFPRDPGITRLKDETFNYLRIFRQDLAIGQQAPTIHLTDTSAVAKSVDFNRASLTLVDICSSWYAPCRLRYEAMRKLQQEVDSTKLQLVSVSLDLDASDWKKSVQYQKANWLQVLDSLVWQGPMLKNYLFDSIPYNFIIGKDGTILAKAVPADSLHSKIGELLNRSK